MSAAEKLGALDEAMPHAPTHIATWPLFWEFRNVLPEIIAVVKAAERKRPDGTLDQVELARALSALDEKL